MNFGSATGSRMRDISSEEKTPFQETTLQSAFKSSFRRFNYRLYLALLLTDLLPTIYTTVRIHYLGELPQTWGVNIASQLQWVNVILEVIQEALIQPLFFCIGVTIKNAQETVNKVKTGLVVTFVVYLICASVIAAAALPLTEWMAQDENVIDETVTYIRLELIGITLTSLVEFLMVVFVLLNAQLHIYLILAIKMSLSILLDSFFFSESLDVSLKLGVNGIAYTNIATSGVTFIYAACVFVKMYARCGWLVRPRFGWLLNWSSVGLFSGLDSLTRNVAYLLMIIRMMNVIKEQGTYWLANSFVWSWLLLPFPSLSKVLMQDTSNTNDVINHRQKTLAYYVIVLCIALVWFITHPGWKGFFRVVLNIENTDDVFGLAIILAPFYMLFMVNTLMDSVFYGKGKTQMLAIQSIITNTVVYGTAFALFKTDVFQPSLVKIAVLFGIGLTVDFLITSILIQDTSNPNDVVDHLQKTLVYYVTALAIAVLWCFTLPGWKGFFDVVLNIKDTDDVFRLAIILAPFYTLYMLNTLMDSLFYGKGKTRMLAIQSILTDILVYGTAFALFKADVFEPSVANIAVLFGIGITVDSFITFSLYCFFLRQVHYKI